MSTRTLRFVIGLVAFLPLLVASQAFAQATRTWVSGVGDDANPCSRTAPCKTWAGAISKTAAGGEMDALDPGGFGAVTITKSITLDGGPGVASILVAGTNAVNISAAATDVVTLRNLAFNGLAQTAGPGLTGINVLSVGSLHVENCRIFGFSKSGIDVAVNAGTPTTLTVSETSITDVSTASGSGIQLAQAGSGPISAALTRVLISGAVVGLRAAGLATVTAQDSVFFGNGIAIANSIGVYATTDASNNGAVINLEGGAISNFTVAVQGDDPALVRLAAMMVGQNGTGLAGHVDSFANNAIHAGNTTDGAPTNVLPLQ